MLLLITDLISEGTSPSDGRSSFQAMGSLVSLSNMRYHLCSISSSVGVGMSAMSCQLAKVTTWITILNTLYSC